MKILTKTNSFPRQEFVSLKLGFMGSKCESITIMLTQGWAGRFFLLPGTGIENHRNCFPGFRERTGIKNAILTYGNGILRELREMRIPAHPCFGRDHLSCKFYKMLLRVWGSIAKKYFWNGVEWRSCIHDILANGKILITTHPPPPICTQSLGNGSNQRSEGSLSLSLATSCCLCRRSPNCSQSGHWQPKQISPNKLV